MLIRAAVATVGIWIVLVGVYYALPIGHRSGVSVLLRLIAGLVGVAVALAWQARRIVGAKMPEVRAAQALATVIPLFLTVFSVLYLSLAKASAGSFSQRLNHTRALYFTITVFSTVGFGDITPTSDPARIVVSIQMLLDLVIIGVVVRLLLNAARVGLARTDDDPVDSP